MVQLALQVSRPFGADIVSLYHPTRFVVVFAQPRRT